MLRGVLNFNGLDGSQFIRYAAVKTTSPQYKLGTLVVNIMALAISRRWRFFLSATLFCWGV